MTKIIFSGMLYVFIGFKIIFTIVACYMIIVHLYNTFTLCIEREPTTYIFFCHIVFFCKVFNYISLRINNTIANIIYIDNCSIFMKRKDVIRYTRHKLYYKRINIYIINGFNNFTSMVINCNCCFVFSMCATINITKLYSHCCIICNKMSNNIILYWNNFITFFIDITEKHSTISIIFFIKIMIYFTYTSNT